MSLETQYIYTQQDARALHEIAIRASMLAVHSLEYALELAKDAAALSDAIDKQATLPAATEPAPEARPMYGVSSVTSIHGKTRYSVAGNIFATEAEAQAAAAALNADSTGQGGE